MKFQMKAEFGKKQLPCKELLDDEPPQSDEKLVAWRRRVVLNRLLDNIQLSSRVLRTHVGATVTRFEISAPPGERLAKITRRLASAIEGNGVFQAFRFIAPIPGKNRIGIDVPNVHRKEVPLRKVLESEAWENPKNKVPLPIGADICNKPVVSSNLGKSCFFAEIINPAACRR